MFAYIAIIAGRVLTFDEAVNGRILGVDHGIGHQETLPKNTTSDITQFSTCFKRIQVAK